jgi:predicted nucleic acid-binding protein
MPAGVLLDTSFLITLADKGRDHHDTARRYWRYFLENQIPIYLSTIVVSEFCVKQEIPPEILKCCVVLPFNWDDALYAAKLDWKKVRPTGVKREALKDDVKIIAQGVKVDTEFVITDDGKSFHKFCEVFKQAGQVGFTAIKLEEGFDVAFFKGGQREFPESPQEDEGEVT